MKKKTYKEIICQSIRREIPTRNRMDAGEKQKTVDTTGEPEGILPYFSENLVFSSQMRFTA